MPVRGLPADIRTFRPVDGNWLPLDGLIGKLWQVGPPGNVIKDPIAIFERFPENDGAGVFWLILDGLEGRPGYELPLDRSLQRHPSEFGVLLVVRMLNGGEADAGGVPLVPLLRSVAWQDDAPERARQMAAKFVSRRSEST